MDTTQHLSTVLASCVENDGWKKVLEALLAHARTEAYHAKTADQQAIWDRRHQRLARALWETPEEPWP